MLPLQIGKTLCADKRHDPRFVTDVFQLQRQTQCDPGLPRCGPCERTNSHCEYYDSTRGKKVPRNYILHLQQKSEKDLEDLDRIKRRSPRNIFNRERHAGWITHAEEQVKMNLAQVKRFIDIKSCGLLASTKDTPQKTSRETLPTNNR